MRPSRRFFSMIPAAIPLMLPLLLLLATILPTAWGFIVRFEINEGVPVDSHVGSLASHGHSASGSLMYNKVPNPKDASRYFNVDKFSGRISVAEELDREALCPLPTIKPNDECVLKFSVACLQIAGGSVEGIADVMVVLRDVNDNGCEFRPASEQVIRIRENADVEKTRIRLNYPFDPDSARLGHSIQWNQVRLEDPSGTFRLYSVHSQSGGNIRNSYSMGYRQQDAQLFLGLLRPLDFETTKQYRISVAAGDGLHECKLALRVEVEDADDNLPVFEKLIYNVTIPENLPPNEKVLTVKARDADDGEFGKVIYSFEPYLTDPAVIDMFRIDPESGDIFRQSQMKYHDSTPHQLTVRASNGETPSGAPSVSYNNPQPSFLTKVFITLEDVNDHAPIITIFSPSGSEQLTLTENMPRGQDVAILSVEDKDRGMNAVVECRLKSQSIRDALSLRPMTSELDAFDSPSRLMTSRKYKLLTTRSFDREQHPEIHFIVECWDGGKPVMRSTQKGTIHILDVNDCAPVFENATHYFRVYEDVSTSTVSAMRNNMQTEQIGHLKARDDDINQNAKLQYQFSPECSQSFLSLIEIDRDAGVLQSTGGLDREKITNLSCKVIVSDMGNPPLSSQTDVKIEVLDMNDNAPQFELSEYTFQVEENSRSGTLVGIVRVFDADLGANSKLEFSLEGVQKHPWNIGADMDSLFSSVRPSREKPSSQHLNLLRFEALPVRKHLLTSSYPWNISHTDGGSTYEVRIYTATPIDRESLVSVSEISSGSSLINSSAESVSLRFILRVQDSGSPRLVSRVPINLRISDVNDNAPTFAFPPMNSENVTEVRLSIKEPVGFQFTKIFASDPDAGENATIMYHIRAGDPFDLFQLDPRSGELSVGKDYSSTGQYMGQYLLFIEASDGGIPRRSSEAQLLIHMDDSEPLGRVERDIFGFPIRSSGRGGGAGSRSMNLYIIAAIIVASLVISSVLLVAICLVVRRARATEQNENAGGGFGGRQYGLSSLQNGSIIHDQRFENGYLKSAPLALTQAKYAACDLLEEDFSEAKFSYLTPQTCNGGYAYEDAVGFQSPGAGSALLAEVSPDGPSSPPPLSQQSGSLFATSAAAVAAASATTSLAAGATPGPDGLIRLSYLPTSKHSHTLARCNLLGPKKLAEDRILGKRNSLTDRDSGNGDSLDVGSCLLAFPSGLEGQRSATPCLQHFHSPHLQFHPASSSPPPLQPVDTSGMTFSLSTDHPMQHHQPMHQQAYLLTASPNEPLMEVVDAEGNPLTSTFV